MIESCNWIDFISVTYASWYHWNCGRTQRKAATINQLACPSYSLNVQLLWYPMYYPGGMKARVSPVQWSKPHSILAPTQDSNLGFRIQNHKRWPLHYHCTHKDPVHFILPTPCLQADQAVENPRVSIFAKVVTRPCIFLSIWGWVCGKEVGPHSWDSVTSIIYFVRLRGTESISYDHVF